MKVIKRDGRKVIYDSSKIYNAVSKAFISVYGNNLTQEDLDKIEEVTEQVDDTVRNKAGKEVNIEDIQDLVESTLMSDRFDDVAKEYIIYRNDRTRIRTRNSTLRKNIMKKAMAEDVQNQNANMDEHSFGGRVGEAAALTSKDIALNDIMSEMARYNHTHNIIYTHDLDHYVYGSHNCFQKKTSFITDKGIKTFENFSDGDKVRILANDGEWRDAVVHKYGRQPMQTVTLRRNKKEVKIDCTANHRWYLSNGKVTENLKEGDTLFYLSDSPSNYSIETERDAEMFAFGFIIGDGCDHYGGKVTKHNYLAIMLCDEKTQYSDIFELAGYHSISCKIEGYKSYAKRSEVSKQSFLDNHMWHALSFRDKVMLFHGYFAADGSKGRNTKKIWTSDERVLSMIKDISALAGYHIHKIKKTEGSTNYVDYRILYDITFTLRQTSNNPWVVEKIKSKKGLKDYEAWCIEEPVTHSFTLEGGIVTGNCLSCPIDDLLAKGFNTRQTDIRPARSISTAFQLLAVIFQIQSLQQFGGVSATHLDHSMVPYFRLSLRKHYILEYVKSTEGFMHMDLIEMDEDELDDWIDKVKDEYLEKFGLTDDDFYLGNMNPNIDKKLWQSALFETRTELFQAVEGMYHNLNSLQSRSGNQLPFSSINYGTCTSKEGRLIIKAILHGSIKGVGKLHKTSIFPCGIFQVGKGINLYPGDPNYDLFKMALKSTAKRLYPNYANIDWSGNAGYDKNDPRTYFSTMGKCKLQPILNLLNLTRGCPFMGLTVRTL